MIEELKIAITKAEKLPNKQQKEIAELIINEVEWEISFQSSPDKLSQMAEEALTEYKLGKTKPMEL
jgi:hypothetical protein